MVEEEVWAAGGWEEVEVAAAAEVRVARAAVARVRAAWVRAAAGAAVGVLAVVVGKVVEGSAGAKGVVAAAALGGAEVVLAATGPAALRHTAARVSMCWLRVSCNKGGT